MKSKVLGSMMMVAGSTIGAGMLVMPINSAYVGFGTTFLELVIFYFLMLIPALAIAEATQFAPQGTTVAGIMQRTFGFTGYISNNILLYVFAYSLACAYISGITNVLAELLSIPDGFRKLFTVLCVIPLGFIVVISTRVSDLINRAMFYIMCLAFVVLVAISLTNINLDYLKASPVSTKAVYNSIPIFFLAYGFHILIPSLSDYLERNVRDLKVALIGGLTIPFVIFTVWNLVVHGQASQEQLIEFAQSKNVNIANLLTKGEENSYLGAAVTVFTLTALLTSFIGLTTALITTLKENFKKVESNQEQGLIQASQEAKVETKLNRVAIFILTFALPAVVVTFSPAAFVFFLGFAAIISTLQAMVMPMIALIKIRLKNPELYQDKQVYRFIIPSSVLGIISVLFLVVAFMADLNF
ncbi:hypothetical protein CKF54_06495 [Psittacicella hinzii]|uniref:Tyrosine-specific transport protein n=1 Tax=Psittacicella hinzii TaxID=2028575 RepID=A0A3A1XZT8_9GAMM|nr:aromatic amino acid transport family protein [Psittacicella hinzii]RIY31562.1 hypothetical protein CKF54_06495 [Psittacicella hinzii]